VFVLIFRDLNLACPKDNYPTPFIDQIIDDYVVNKIFLLMDGFSGYNQIQIKPENTYFIKSVNILLRGLHEH